MSDVQSMRPVRKFHLARVGIKGVKKLLYIKRGGRTVPLTAEISACVDLPPELKGIHMSRNVEVINEVVEESTKGRKEFESLEEVMMTICEGLLRRHEYAERAYARAKAYYFLDRKTPLGRLSNEYYKILAGAKAIRGKGIRRKIGVEVIGASACPCAMDTVKEKINCDKDVGITHNQRCILKISVITPQDYEVEADELIEIAEASFSSPTYEYLKRDDEAELVIRMHSRPKFVEDIVRDVIAEFLRRFPDIPGGSKLSVRCESLETIHKHNAYAERSDRIEALRREFSSEN